MAADEQDRNAVEAQLALEAAERWRNRTAPRVEQVNAADRGKYTEAESPERLVKRAERLKAFVAARSQQVGTDDEGAREILSVPTLTPETVTDAAFERIIGETRDFLSTEYFERGLHASVSVGRVLTDDTINGTGFLVAPGMLMTNWHVIDSVEKAARSTFELDYEANTFGPQKTAQSFDLDPDFFFITDKDHDFTIVAVKDTSHGNRSLKDYGFIPLVGGEGKITIGEPVNIIQHPKGRFKQMAIRNSKLLDLFESDPETRYFHYEADTEKGSSGCPVFNDQWEIVALHHSAVPKTNKQGKLVDEKGRILAQGEEDSIVWIANEGIRTSRLVQTVQSAAVPSPDHDKRRAALLAIWQEAGKPGAPVQATESAEPPVAPPRPAVAVVRTTERAVRANLPEPAPRERPTGRATASITLPLRIHITLGDEDDSISDRAQAPVGPAFTEAASPDPDDPDYSLRPGYDPGFLGFDAPLPTLADATHGPLLTFGAGRQSELKYHHFSVLMNERRRLAYVAAVNLWSAAPFEHEREGGSEAWLFDPRLRPAQQAGKAYYSSNPLDRGHLVRRDDAAWGKDTREAKLANDDTFHWTNCSPQHEIFNQSARASSRGLKLWGNLENAVSALAPTHGTKLSVFNGPIFADSDRPYRQDFFLPAAFWKLILVVDETGKPRALAFQLSQAEQLDMLAKERFAPDELADFETFQISLAQLTAVTGLDFGVIAAFDPLAEQPSSTRSESAAPEASAILLTGESSIRM